ncbi:MAG: transglutaminase domain-containing protein, partial [Gemmatimonadaceae bacterium]
MTTQQVPTTEQILDYYTRATALTAPGKYAPMFSKLPNDLRELVRIVQGVAIHEFVAADFYGFKVPESRKFESHIRSVERMLERLFEIDDRPLTVARPPEKRLVGVCHHFMMLLLAMLRAKG